MTSKMHCNYPHVVISGLLLLFFTFPSISPAETYKYTALERNTRDQLSRAIVLSVSQKHEDKKKAFQIYSTLAAKGVKESYYFLGNYYSSQNKATNIDYNKAMNLYEKAAEVGEKNAASTLATFYAIGVLGEKDYKSAAKWYEKSIGMGNKSDLLKLGYFYQNGYGVNLDYDKAMSLYKEALALGIDDSQKSIDELVKIINTRNMLYGRVLSRIINATLFDYLTAISFLLAIVFYLKSRKDKILKYDIRSFNVIKNSINDYKLLTVEYDGHKIENLSITKIAVWNSGKESIRNTDIPKSSPISFIVDEGIVLNSNIIAQNNHANMFSCEISDDKHSVNINFEFIDYDNAAIIELLHTGTTISVSGCVIGGNDIAKSQFSKLSPQIRKKTIIGVLITTIAFVVADIAAIYNYNNIVESQPELMIIVFIVILAFTILCLLLISGCFSLLKSKPMSGFDIEN